MDSNFGAGSVLACGSHVQALAGCLAAWLAASGEPAVPAGDPRRARSQSLPALRRPSVALSCIVGIAAMGVLCSIGCGARAADTAPPAPAAADTVARSQPGDTAASADSGALDAAAGDAHAQLPPDGAGIAADALCPVAGSGTAVVTFADKQAGPRGVAVDGGYVYWTATNGVYRRSLTLGPIEKIDTSLGSAGALAVSDGTVYFAHPNLGQVLRVAAAGGTAEVLATASAIGGLAVDAERVWFTVLADNGFVGWVPKGGGATTKFATDLAFPWGVALSGDSVAWTTAGGDGKGTSGKLWHGSKQSIAIAPLIQDSMAAGPLVLNAGKIHWGEAGKLRTIATDLTENQTIYGESGKVVAIARAGEQIVFSVADSAASRIGRIHGKGGAVTWLATHQRQPFGVATGQGCVFWANFGGGPLGFDGSIAVRDLAATAPGTPGSCAGPNPAGCLGQPKDYCPPTGSGQKTVCVQNGLQEGCFPSACTCDAATATWTCDVNCSGGICKPVCETTKPTVNCCKGGQFAKPQCDNGVFSCPADTVGKPFAGCGAHDGPTKPVVTCGNSACQAGDYCCYSIVPNCSKTLTACYAIQSCEGSHQCGSGEACCASGVTAGSYIATQCKPAAECGGAPNWRACGKAADCPAGQNCCKKAKDGNFGLCHAGECG